VKIERILNIGYESVEMENRGVSHKESMRNREWKVRKAGCYAQYFKDSKDLLSLKFRLLDK
jgi:hypothetical protein